VFYGWWVVLTAGIGLFLGYAPVFVFSFTVFVKSLVQEFHSGRTSISLAFALANLMQAPSAPLAGRLVDRFGARKVILPSTVVFGLVLISFKYFSTDLWQLYALFIVSGFIGIGTSPIPYGITASRWFDKKRGLALGLMMGGLSCGAIVMPSIAQHLGALFGWRTAYAIIGFAVLAVPTPVVWLLLKDTPEKMGLLPDGEKDLPAGSVTRSNNQGMTPHAALRSGTFWFMACAFFLVGTTVHGCAIHLVPLLTDRGISAEKAALASSLLGIALLLGRVLSGYLLDRVHGPYLAAFVFSGVACGVALLWTGAGGSLAFLAAFLVGLGMGAEADIIAYLTSRYFGLRSFGQIYGYVFGTYILSGALGPMLMGIGFDRGGSYRVPLLFFLMATITAVVLLTRLGTYTYRAA
jgi:MFS family permease